MRQFFIFLCFFSCASVLADHGRSDSWNYNGRTFYCTDFDKAKEWAENAKKLSETKVDEGKFHSIWAFCQLYHGPKYLPAALESLQTALDKGNPSAAFTLAKYFISDGFNLPKGTMTDNIPDLNEAIRYRELALQIISESNYPFSDPYGDDLAFEKAEQPYLTAAGNIPTNYIGLFIKKIKFHRNSTDKDIKTATIDALKNTITAAETCLAIKYIKKPVVVWSRSVYDKNMARCEASKLIAETLLPLEKERLRIASENCKGTKLSKCTAHQTIEKEMLKAYKAYKVIVDQLIQQLAAL